MLSNDIVDLSKIESGTVAVDVSELRLIDLRSYVERTFRHVAESKGLEFSVRLDPTVPRSMVTDSKRLQQVIKNLLANAFKFTQRGTVSLEIKAVGPEAARDRHSPLQAVAVLPLLVHPPGHSLPRHN